jgi:hypothetical protein
MSSLPLYPLAALPGNTQVDIFAFYLSSIGRGHPASPIFFPYLSGFRKKKTIAMHRHAYHLLSSIRGLIVESLKSVDLSEFAWPFTRVPMRATI